MKTAIKELAAGVLAIVAITLGLVVIAVINETAIEMATVWWQWIVGLAISGAISAVALAVIFAATLSTVGTMAAGWVGMLAGRVPAGFADRRANLGSGIGGLLLCAACGILGVVLYRAGLRDGNANWAVEGLFLAAGGMVLGVGPAIPRLYFAARGAGDPVEKRSKKQRWRNKRKNKESDGAGAGAAVVATAALLSIGLSMCTADLIATMDTRDGKATLRYGDWLEGCLDASGQLEDECPKRMDATLDPRVRGSLQLEWLGRCDVAIEKAGGGQPGGKARLGGLDERSRWSLPAGRYHVAVTTKTDCAYMIRYRSAPEAR